MRSGSTACPQPLHRPFVVEVVPPANMAAGTVPWGLGSWVQADSLRRVSTGTPAGGMAAAISALLAEAAGRSLVIVVRDAHRHPGGGQLTSRSWPPGRTRWWWRWACRSGGRPRGLYLATFGAARTSSRAAAEVLGLAGPRPRR